MYPKLEEAFSQDGYIIDQDKTGDIRYGRYRSNYNGCGWIAAFNLLKATGRPQGALQTSQELIYGSPYNGKLGTGPRRLQKYLQGKGCRLTCASTRQLAAGIAKNSRAGILFYINRENGPHFACYVRSPGGQLRFLNALAGCPQHLCTMPQFLASQARHFPIYLMAVL